MKDFLDNDLAVKDFIIIDKGYRSTTMSVALITEVTPAKVKYLYVSYHDAQKNLYHFGKSFTSLKHKVCKINDMFIPKETCVALWTEANKIV